MFLYYTLSMKTIILAGGCFWGLEDLFRHEPGVVATEVGYTGGTNANPTYNNHPGHAETIKITYDPKVTSYQALLDFFFRIHDPTTIDRQGNDVGSSYRSAIFYETNEQKLIAQSVIKAVNQSGLYSNPIVTTLEPLTTFYSAEDYHQNYLVNNPGGYTCHYLRTPNPIIND